MEDRRREPRRGPVREHTSPAGHRDQGGSEGVEPDFTDDPGATDPGEAVEDGEPYFPPTDPVARPRPGEGLDPVGGLGTGSMDETGPEGEVERGSLPGDEQIKAGVMRELREDALTADLQVEVLVRDGRVVLRGTVPSLEDGEAVADVAARVTGVREVLDETEVAGQAE